MQQTSLAIQVDKMKGGRGGGDHNYSFHAWHDLNSVDWAVQIPTQNSREQFFIENFAQRLSLNNGGPSKNL